MKLISVLFFCSTLLFSQGVIAHAKTNQQTIQLSVTENGFEPASIEVKPGTDVTLEVTRKTEQTCATNIKIPSLKIGKALPLNKKVKIKLGKLAAGELHFACQMNMDTGVILVR
ncbi:MAG: cupredoxin domain-containing protein [Bdellovibrionota bacterium]